MPEKFWYSVSLLAEEELTGWVQLTEEEAFAVAKATDQRNWRNIVGGGWCGNFYIDLINKRKSLEAADNLDYLQMEQREQM